VFVFLGGLRCVVLCYIDQSGVEDKFSVISIKQDLGANKDTYNIPGDRGVVCLRHRNERRECSNYDSGSK
jgi:hypothetical protein